MSARDELTAKLYDSLSEFNAVACWSVLRLPQMRQYLAEHLAVTLAGEEKASATAPTATPTPEFFQPGHTYRSTRHAVLEFRCLTVDTNPATGELRAFGWRYSAYPDEWRGAALNAYDWDCCAWVDDTEAHGEKATASAATATPRPAAGWHAARDLTGRLGLLLEHIRTRPDHAWIPSDVHRFGLAAAEDPCTCSRDLEALAALGWLVERQEPGRRVFVYNPQKDGRS